MGLGAVGGVRARLGWAELGGVGFGGSGGVSEGLDRLGQIRVTFLVRFAWVVPPDYSENYFCSCDFWHCFANRAAPYRSAKPPSPPKVLGRVLGEVPARNGVLGEVLGEVLGKVLVLLVPRSR